MKVCRGGASRLLELCLRRWNVLSIAFWNATLGHLFDALFLLTSLVHPLQLLLHRSFLSLGGCLGSLCFLRRCWLVRDVRREGALLHVLFVFILFFCLFCFVSLVFAHFVQSFVCRCCFGRSHRAARCLFRGYLRRECTLFQLSRLLCLLSLIFPG